MVISYNFHFAVGGNYHLVEIYKSYTSENGVSDFVIAFESVSEMQGNLIAREIYSSLNRWEPRVDVVGVDVTGIRDINEYEIILSVRIPYLKNVFNLKGILTRQGVTFS